MKSSKIVDRYNKQIQEERARLVKEIMIRRPELDGSEVEEYGKANGNVALDEMLEILKQADSVVERFRK